MMTGVEKIRSRWAEIDSMAGVGIDPDLEKIPRDFVDSANDGSSQESLIFAFNRMVIDATVDYAVDFKVNSNFFQGPAGRTALYETFRYLKDAYPRVLRICDGKFGDVGHTAEKIADEVFGQLDADGVLLNPYLGYDAIKPFTDYTSKLAILCIKTSNQSSSEVQNSQLATGEPLWKKILRLSMEEWNGNRNIIPVLSANSPEDLVGIREIIGDTPILLAGVGMQGGSLVESVPLCLDDSGYGVMISSSRSILYPDRLPNESHEMASRRAVMNLRESINAAKGYHD